jgi:hypothetical protein
VDDRRRFYIVHGGDFYNAYEGYERQTCITCTGQTISRIVLYDHLTLPRKIEWFCCFSRLIPQPLNRSICGPSVNSESDAWLRNPLGKPVTIYGIISLASQPALEIHTTAMLVLLLTLIKW